MKLKLFFKRGSVRLTENSSFRFLFSVCAVLMEGISDIWWPVIHNCDMFGLKMYCSTGACDAEPHLYHDQ